MINWVDVGIIEPPRRRNLICFCLEWCETDYQIARWNGKEFYYDEQPNDLFNLMVVKWAIFLDAD